MYVLGSKQPRCVCVLMRIYNHEVSVFLAAYSPDVSVFLRIYNPEVSVCLAAYSPDVSVFLAVHSPEVSESFGSYLPYLLQISFVNHKALIVRSSVLLIFVCIVAHMCFRSTM